VKRPARVRILGKPFAVSYLPAGTPPLELDDVGDCQPDLQKITVLDGLPLETEQDATLHEILHAIDAAMTDEITGEEVINRLATGLLAVIKDNPRLVSYLRMKSKPERKSA
jgi:hypothetical protein